MEFHDPNLDLISPTGMPVPLRTGHGSKLGAAAGQRLPPRASPHLTSCCVPPLPQQAGGRGGAAPAPHPHPARYRRQVGAHGDCNRVCGGAQGELHYVQCMQRKSAYRGCACPATCRRQGCAPRCGSRHHCVQASRCMLHQPQRLQWPPHCFVQEAGASNARLKLYKGKTHTKPIVEDPSESPPT